MIRGSISSITQFESFVKDLEVECQREDKSNMEVLNYSPEL